MFLPYNEAKIDNIKKLELLTARVLEVCPPENHKVLTLHLRHLRLAMMIDAPPEELRKIARDLVSHIYPGLIAGLN